ncbi:MAG: hypothetical protein QM736_13790 [Vicinamibacterales bacterium]
MRRLLWLAALFLASLPSAARAQTSDTIPPTVDFSQSGYFESGTPVTSVDVTSTNAELTLRLYLLDDLSGVTFSNYYDEVFVLRSPSGQQRRVLHSYDFVQVSGDGLAGAWEATLTMPQGSEDGTWIIEKLHARDVVGNRRYYFEGDTALTLFPSLEVTSSADLHAAGADRADDVAAESRHVARRCERHRDDAGDR